jgi:hypothetical protein
MEALKRFPEMSGISVDNITSQKARNKKTLG